MTLFLQSLFLTLASKIWYYLVSIYLQCYLLIFAWFFFAWFFICLIFFSLFHFTSIYSLYGGDLLWQFWIALHCTLVRLPPPSLSHHPNPESLKAITKCFIVLFPLCIWSPSTLFLYLHLLHSPSPFWQVHPHCTYFSVLSFIIHSKVNVQRSFSMYPSCEFVLLRSVQPLLLLFLTPSLLIPHYSVAFSTYHYVFDLIFNKTQ
jgi:hypothetical protein